MNAKVDITNTTLETPRLILRPWKTSDIDDFFEYAKVPGVGEMAGWPHHTSKDTSKMVMESFIEGKNVFAIVHKESKKVIGSFGIHNSWASSDQQFEGKTCAELGYVLSKDFWGQGLMPEAAKRVIEFCFDSLDIDILTIGHFTDNLQSKRVIEKCGFTFHSFGKYYSRQLKKEFDEMKYIMYK